MLAVWHSGSALMVKLLSSSPVSTGMDVHLGMLLATQVTSVFVHKSSKYQNNRIGLQALHWPCVADNDISVYRLSAVA